jgi:hypothetical protein
MSIERNKKGEQFWGVGQNIKRKPTKNDEAILSHLHKIAAKIRKGTFHGIIVVGENDTTNANSVSIGMVGLTDTVKFLTMCENVIESVQLSAIKNAGEALKHM